MALPSSSPPPAPAPAPRLDSVLSFTLTHADDDAHQDAHAEEDVASDASSVDSDFEFAFAPPLHGDGAPSLDDDLFAHGRIVPAYPVLDRGLPPPAAATAQPSPDTYCPWVPHSAPGSPSPATDPAAFPKCASTGQATSSARRWRLRDLLGAGDRSHSDGKEKFVFLQPPAKTSPAVASNGKQTKKQSTGTSGRKKKTAAAAAVTDMDMATAHRLFYGKPAGAATAAAGHHHQQTSYLPYRPGIVGFFATAHALRRSHHHPY